MPKVVYVQITGNETPARVLADAVEERRISGDKDGSSLILRNGEAEGGKFRLGHVVGWWIQEEI